MTEVATFACPCGARDEVLAPAPATVDCWSCGGVLRMKPWTPRVPVPSGNARQLTDAEAARLAADALDVQELLL